MSKLKAAGKYGACRLKADAKAVKSGAAADYAKCDAALAHKWDRAERAAAGSCPTEGDQPSLRLFITQHADNVAAALLGGSLPSCGNGIVDSGEECDQGNLNGETCATQGFIGGGTLACGAGCVFDDSGCWSFRFVDNGDGTVSDRLTGLMWEKKTELDDPFALDYTRLHDADLRFDWGGFCTGGAKCQPTTDAASLCTLHTAGFNTGCATCPDGLGPCSSATTIWTWAVQLNEANFAGYSDWRIPSRAELLSLVNYDFPFPNAAPLIDAPFRGASCGTACTDVTNPACSCTNPSQYWTTSKEARFGLTAWTVDFGSGSLFLRSVQNPFFVRAVRGGS